LTLEKFIPNISFQCSQSIAHSLPTCPIVLLQAVSECILVDLLTLWTLREDGTSDWMLGKLVPQKGCPEVRGRKGRECSLFSSFACISLQDTHLSTLSALYLCFSHFPSSFFAYFYFSLLQENSCGWDALGFVHPHRVDQM